MEKLFKKAFRLMFVPVIINLVITVMCYINLETSLFKGYLAGTVLSMIFTAIWLVMAKRVSLSNAMVLLTMTLGAFPVKIVVFAIFAFGGLYVLKMNQMYFGFSFLLGTILSLVIEVWFIISVNRLHLLSKSGAVAADKKE